MEDNIFDKVHDVDLQKTMETYYIDYAMSVIASRALPDVRFVWDRAGSSGFLFLFPFEDAL